MNLGCRFAASSLAFKLVVPKRAGRVLVFRFWVLLITSGKSKGKSQQLVFRSVLYLWLFEYLQICKWKTHYEPVIFFVRLSISLFVHRLVFLDHWTEPNLERWFTKSQRKCSLYFIPVATIPTLFLVNGAKFIRSGWKIEMIRGSFSSMCYLFI